MKLSDIADNAGSRKKRIRVGRIADLPDTAATRGMIKKVHHLVEMEGEGK